MHLCAAIAGLAVLGIPGIFQYNVLVSSTRLPYGKLAATWYLKPGIHQC